MKILVCDSDPSVISLIRFVLAREMLGEVVVTTSNREAMGMLRKLAFDLVITETKADRYSGLEIVTFLRQDLHLNTPVLLLANSGQEDEILNGFKAGASDYLLKPFSLQELALRIKRLQITQGDNH